MIQAYDHRAASVEMAEQNWMRQGQPEPTSLVEHQNPEFCAQPRWWVSDAEVLKRSNGWKMGAEITFKEITSATNQRTVIAAFSPHIGFMNSAPITFIDETLSIRLRCCLLANLNAMALDYVARQKVGGLHLNFFIVNQFPVLPPDRYANACPWDKSVKLVDWISERVLKLSCTANDLKPLAVAAGFKPTVYKWKPEELAGLLAELDAAYFHLYSINRDDAEYILGTFQGSAEDGTLAFEAGFSMRSSILQAFDRLAK